MVGFTICGKMRLGWKKELLRSVCVCNCVVCVAILVLPWMFPENRFQSGLFWFLASTTVLIKAGEKWMWQLNVSKTHSFMGYVYKGCYTCADELLAIYGRELLEFRNFFDETPLLTLCYTKLVEKQHRLPGIVYLLERGADVNAYDLSGSTALHLTSDIVIWEELLKRGFDLNVENNGTCPLDGYMAGQIDERIKMAARYGGWKHRDLKTMNARTVFYLSSCGNKVWVMKALRLVLPQEIVEKIFKCLR